MGIINQPRQSNLGDALNHLLTSREDYSGTHFYILVAYAKRSGVSRIRESIETFRKRGGEVTAIVGVDQNNMSVQGLQGLLDIADELYVFHSEAPFQTFHPKVYVLVAGGQEATAFIGSSNLTSGGLYTNYEVIKEVHFDLTVEEDRSELRNIQALIESYKDTHSPCSKLVDQELFNRLYEEGYLANEEVRQAPAGSRREAEGGEAEREPIFGTERFVAPPVRIVVEGEEPAGEVVPQTETVREGFWKILSENDVSTTSSPGQMIIPIRYLPLFPAFFGWQTMPSGARQSEVFFNVIFSDYQNRRHRIDGVRAIHYVPAPHHPRPNQELRFTFRNREILLSLNRDDMLVFRRTANPDIWFDIRHLRQDSPEYASYASEGRRFGSITVSTD